MFQSSGLVHKICTGTKFTTVKTFLNVFLSLVLFSFVSVFQENFYYSKVRSQTHGFKGLDLRYFFAEISISDFIRRGKGGLAMINIQLAILGVTPLKLFRKERIVIKLTD